MDTTLPLKLGPLRRLVKPAVTLLVCALVLGLVHKLSRDIDYHGMVRAMRHMPVGLLAVSLAATALSFAALIGRDVCALSYVGRRVPRGTMLLAAFCGSALGNSAGFGALAGGAVRYRMYGADGPPPEAVARMMVFMTVAFGVGLFAFGAIGAVMAGPVIGPLIGAGPDAVRGGGFLVLAVVAGLLAACAVWRRPLTIKGVRMALPTPALALVQMGLTGLDLIGAAGALWILLPAGHIDFASFAAVYAVATVLAVLSHVPGGVGVFEAVVVVALGDHVSASEAAAALLVYRGIYYLLPLVVSAVLLAGLEARRAASGGAVEGALRLVPTILGLFTFGIGVMLLVSGATPALGHRLAALSASVPLWAVETSNLLSSVTGVILLFVARGLLHRLDGAWILAVVIAAANLLLALFKGLAYGEAAVLSVLIVLLAAARGQFDRPAGVLRQPFTLGWFTAVAIVLTVVVWIQVFAFRDVQYTHDLWWQFEFDAQAPRALRAVFGSAILALAWALGALLRAAPGRVAPPSADELDRAAAIIRAQDRADAALALMGDKSFLFSASGRSFLMYARQGRSWVALYDPVGPRREWAELIWQLVEKADSHDGRVAFYEVRPDSLPFYLDAGLEVRKLGEEARVSLADFSTEGKAGAEFRHILKRAERDGLTVEVRDPGQAEDLWADLEAISQSWLALRKATEKGFSVAAFVAPFVRAQMVALLRHAGKPAAFVTVMVTGTKAEATVGLMRHAADAPRSAMDALFVQLALHLKASGYQVFSLGMAPLSGVASTPLSSPWHRIGALFWRHGGRFYGFQGLRGFKDKFNPAWEPRYLAASGSIGQYVAVGDVIVLTGGGANP